MRTLFHSWFLHLLAVALLAAGCPARSQAKSYRSGGGRSYSSPSSSHGSTSSGSRSAGLSSSSSRSSAGGTSRSSSSAGRSFSSSSGKSYSSGSTWSDDSRRGYTSAKSYASGAGPTFSSSSARTVGAGSSPSSFSFDSPAARARKEEGSKQEFSRFKESALPAAIPPSPLASASGRAEIPGTAAATPSYRVTAPPLPSSASGSYRRPVYVPDANVIVSRPARSYTVFYPYFSRPMVSYRDPYNSFFWWWLLDRSLDDRAMWAYHHQQDMDPARYQALLANNQQLEGRVAQLETQQVPRNPNYAPPGLDRDLMYSDRHVTRAYSNRPTTSGKVTFWVLAVPLALGAGCFLTWLIFLKRWQPST